jgi:hypothetical protein
MKTVIGLLLGVVLLLSGYTWLVLHWSYSTGERAGYVQKFSRKGWVCKTWEGEMALVSMPGTVAEKFFFSVRDDAVAKRINDSVGRRVSLTYDQHIGVPTSCFGETQYFVDDIQAVDEAGLEARPQAIANPGERPPTR